MIVPDGTGTYEPGFLLVPFEGAAVEELPQQIRERLDAEGLLHMPYNPVLVRVPDATILVDAGAGRELAEEWDEPVGLALDSLASAGVDRAEVDVVVITHGHPDHVGGLTELGDDGERIPVFPSARHVISRVEWHFWMEDTDHDPSARMAPVTRPHLAALRDAGVLDLVDGGHEIALGVTLFPTPGHTPGHVSVLVRSEWETCVVAGDAIMTEWGFEHPEWTARPEVDPELTIASRRALLDRLVADDGLLTAYHVPGMGHVRAAGEVYEFVTD